MSLLEDQAIHATVSPSVMHITTLGCEFDIDTRNILQNSSVLHSLLSSEMVSTARSFFQNLHKVATSLFHTDGVLVFLLVYMLLVVSLVDTSIREYLSMR